MKTLSIGGGATVRGLRPATAQELGALSFPLDDERPKAQAAQI